METKEWINGLSVRTKIIISAIFLATIVAAIIYVGEERRYQHNQYDVIAAANIALEIKTGKINALLAVMDNRDSATRVLVAENHKKDELLKNSEANKKLIAEKYRQELARQQTLSDTAAYRLFLFNVGCNTFKGGKYDSAYLVPIESLWAANGVAAENNMLASLNKILTYDATVYKMKIKDLDAIVANGDKNIVDLKSALQVSESKKNEYGQQIDSLNKKIRSNKRKTVVTYIVGSLALIGAIIL